MTIDVLDLFSGCGGLSYGFHKNKSFRIWGAADTDQYANATYARNFRAKPLLADISALTADDLATKLPARDVKDPLVVIGGPPCQGFSSHRKKDPRHDKRNSLVLNYAELAVELKADAIVIENVPDIFSRKHWHHYQSTISFLSANGYEYCSGVVNFAEFGVPQERYRAIIIATKRPLNPSLPSGIFCPDRFRTVRDAIGHLPPLAAGTTDANDPMHITSRHRPETIKVIKKVPKDGGSRPKGVGPKCLDRVEGFYDVYGRLYWDKPAVTITARCRTPSCGRFIHPSQDRGLSVREAALLQGFPKTFYFEGPFDDKYKQIGNAVPPLFSVRLAAHIKSIFKSSVAKKRPAVSQQVLRPITNSFSTQIAIIKRMRK